MRLKSPATFPEQVAAIQAKGVTVTDPAKLERMLHSISYYRLSAYFLPYKTRNGLREVDIESIIGSYFFDGELRSWLYGIIGEIELYTRSVLASHIASTYGAAGYLQPNMYNQKHRHEAFLERIEGVIRDNRKTDAVKHHLARYEGKFPIWVIIEFFSTGMLSFFYADLQRTDKKAIAKGSFNTGDQQLESWLRALTELRNKCAHYTRFYYWPFTTVPRQFNGARWRMDNTLFSQIYMLAQLCPTSQTWNEHVRELNIIIDRYQAAIQLRHIGFPENWEYILTTTSPSSIK